jgi:polyhydroxybutyrate depolymerase
LPVSAAAARRPITTPMVTSRDATLLTPGDYPETLSVGGFTRHMTVHVPPVSSVAGRPLILVYHGAGGTMASTVAETNFEQVANQQGDNVVFLQGFSDTWNEGAGHTPAEQAHVDDVAFTSAVLNELTGLVDYNPKKVAATGISNGALMVEDLGCHLSSRISLIVPVEGEIPIAVSSICAVSRPMNVYEIHGTADPNIPYGGGHFNGVGGGTTVLSAPASVARWAHLDGCSPHLSTVHLNQTVILTKYSHCRGNVNVTLRTIVGGLHVWGSNIGQIVTQVLGQ